MLKSPPLICLSTLLLFALSLVRAADGGTALPNFVIVLADDMGWGDPQCYQADSKIPTPHIDRLAKEGIRFTDAHSPSSVCTPTRYGLLTGRYAWRTRMKSGVLDGFDPPLVRESEDTIATLLKRAGYQTHCIGKWHLGMQWTAKNGSPIRDRDVSKGFRQGREVDFSVPVNGGPQDVGFDTFFGISASLDMSPYSFIRGNRVTVLPNIETQENRDGMFMNQVEGVTDQSFRLEDVLPRIGDEASRRIRESARSGVPFFVYFPLTSPHLPVVPTPDVSGLSEAGDYGDFVVETDRALGKILEALDDTDQTKNTLVLFSSDNGGLFHWWNFRAYGDGGAAPRTRRGDEVRRFAHQSNADWRGTKADIFEGGHRVPFLIRWPEQVSAGLVSSVTVELTDIYATVAEIVEEPVRGTSGMDSFSLLPFLSGNAKSVRPFSIHHSSRGLFAIRKGNWKLIDGNGSGGFTQPRVVQNPEYPGQLYNLDTDPQERENRYMQERERVNEMKALLHRVKQSGARKAAEER